MGVVTITILRPIEDISEFKYFEINPSTIGAEKLGMLVGHEAARKECVVEWIQDGGMLSLYNQKNPSQALRVGDSIVQVNNVVGVRFDAAAMHEELQRSHSVTFKIRFKRKKHAVSYETGLEDCPSHVEVSQSSSQPRGELLVYLGVYDRVSEVPDYLKSSRPFYQSRKDGEHLMWHYLWYSQEARAWQIGDPGTEPRYAVVLVSSPSGQHATCPFEVQKGMWAEYFVSLDHESSNGSTWKTNPGIQVLPVESV
jgi:hypothetical protein